MTTHPDYADDYPNLAYDLAQYLHRVGIVQNPDAVQHDGGELPTVWLTDIPADYHGAAIRIATVGMQGQTPALRDSDDANPEIDLLIFTRGNPDDMIGVEATAARIYRFLHNQSYVQLTTAQTLLHCRRTARGTVGHDQNRRYTRADIYTARPRVTTD